MGGGCIEKIIHFRVDQQHQCALERAEAGLPLDDAKTVAMQIKSMAIKLPSQNFSAAQRDHANNLAARWVAKCMRPVSIVEDVELKEWISYLSRGSYLPPCRATVKTKIRQRAAQV
jgi:hypothetical protein